MQIEIRQLFQKDISLLESLNTMFGEAFDDMRSYTQKRPKHDYLAKLLDMPTFIALAAIKDGSVIGGIAAYELQKFEQERNEIYIYDLAVSSSYRRKGVATGLIEKLKAIGAERGAYVIFVQADTSIEDQPAIALYSKLGTREDVLHFDISIDGKDGNG